MCCHSWNSHAYVHYFSSRHCGILDMDVGDVTHWDRLKDGSLVEPSNARTDIGLSLDGLGGWRYHFDTLEVNSAPCWFR